AMKDEKQSDKKYGTGTVFRPTGRTIWRIQYWANGKRHVESSESTDRRVAVRLLRERLKRPLDTVARRATFDDLVEMLKADYRRKQNRSVDRALRCVAHLRAFFERVAPIRVDFAIVEQYINSRLDSGAAHATVKQERAILGRMLHLASEAKILPYRPALPAMGEPDNARQGFFEEYEFRAVHEQLPPDLRPFFQFMYLTGWRGGEVRGLTWKKVDFRAGTVRLQPGSTKARDECGRVCPVARRPALAELLQTQYQAAMALEREKGDQVPWLFHRAGRPIRSYHEAWRAACARADLPGRYPHDFRRTAVRRLERAGVPRSQAKRLVGHKTDAIYERYAIVAERDLREAVGKVAAQLEADGRPGPATEASAIRT